MLSISIRHVLCAPEPTPNFRLRCKSCKAKQAPYEPFLYVFKVFTQKVKKKTKLTRDEHALARPGSGGASNRRPAKPRTAHAVESSKTAQIGPHGSKNSRGWVRTSLEGKKGPGGATRRSRPG